MIDFMLDDLRRPAGKCLQPYREVLILIARLDAPVALPVGIIGLLIGNTVIRRRFFHEYRDKYIAAKLNDYK